LLLVGAERCCTTGTRSRGRNDDRRSVALRVVTRGRYAMIKRVLGDENGEIWNVDDAA
jgi:hypothetical protein